MTDEEKPEEKPEEKKPDKPKESQGESKPLSPLEEARALDASLEKRNAEFKEQLDRQEKMMANQMLGGHADAGQAPVKKKEISNEEYANAAVAGNLPEND